MESGNNEKDEGNSCLLAAAASKIDMTWICSYLWIPLFSFFSSSFQLRRFIMILGTRDGEGLKGGKAKICSAISLSIKIHGKTRVAMSDYG